MNKTRIKGNGEWGPAAGDISAQGDEGRGRSRGTGSRGEKGKKVLGREIRASTIPTCKAWKKGTH